MKQESFLMNSNSFIIFGSLNVVFTHSYAYALREMGYNVTVIDIGETRIDYSALREAGICVYEWSFTSIHSNFLTGIKSAIKKLLKSIKLDRSKLFNFLAGIYANGRASKDVPEHLKQILRNNLDSYFLFLWSTTAAAHKRKVDEFSQSHGETRQSFLIVNTYPVRDHYSYDDAPEMSQADKEYFKSFKKILVPTREMSYLFSKIGYTFPNVEVHPDILHPKYVAKNFTTSRISKIKAFEDGPSLTFLGNTNFSERSIDDVSSTLRFFSEHDFQVHFQKHQSANSIIFPKASAILFEPFSYAQMANGLLSEYISRNDFVFVGYNKMDNARSYVSFPTRLALAVLGNRKILLEKNQFVAAGYMYNELFSYSSTGISIGDKQFAVMEPKYDDEHFYFAYEKMFWTHMHSIINRMMK